MSTHDDTPMKGRYVDDYHGRSGMVVGLRRGKLQVVRYGDFLTPHVIGRPKAGDRAYRTHGGDFQTQETPWPVGVFLSGRDEDGWVMVRLQ